MNTLKWNFNKGNLFGTRRTEEVYKREKPRELKDGKKLKLESAAIGNLRSVAEGIGVDGLGSKVVGCREEEDAHNHRVSTAVGVCNKTITIPTRLASFF